MVVAIRLDLPWLLPAGWAALGLLGLVAYRAAPHTIQRGGHLAPVSAFAGMAIFSAGGALFSAPVIVAIKLDQPWLLPAGWAALGLLGLAAYRAALPRQARLFHDRREAILEAICGDED